MPQVQTHMSMLQSNTLFPLRVCVDLGDALQPCREQGWEAVHTMVSLRLVAEALRDACCG